METRSEPSVDKLIKVIKYLGLSADELFDISPKRKINEEENIKNWNTKEKYIRLGIDNIINSNSIEEIHDNAYTLKIIIDDQL